MCPPGDYCWRSNKQHLLHSIFGDYMTEFLQAVSFKRLLESEIPIIILKKKYKYNCYLLSLAQD